MKIILMLVLSLTGLSAFSQGRSHNEILEDFLKQRKQMMEKMMKAFDDDSFFNNDDFSSMNGFKISGSNIEITERQLSDGNIEIMITPKKDNINMDIQTQNNRITIKTETRVEKSTDQGGNVFKSQSMSSSSRSIAIPEGYQAKSPVGSGKSIKITLVPNEKIKKIVLPSNGGKIPLKKRRGEETI